MLAVISADKNSQDKMVVRNYYSQPSLNFRLSSATVSAATVYNYLLSNNIPKADVIRHLWSQHMYMLITEPIWDTICSNIYHWKKKKKKRIVDI